MLIYVASGLGEMEPCVLEERRRGEISMETMSRVQEKMRRAAQKEALKFQQPRQKSALSLTDRVFIWFARPISQKYGKLRERADNPKLAAARDILISFEKTLSDVGKKLSQGKQPKDQTISTIMTMLPLIGCIPMKHWELESRVHDAFITVAHISNAIKEGPLQTALVGMLSLVDEARQQPEE
jgi:hypothetical protein